MKQHFKYREEKENNRILQSLGKGSGDRNYEPRALVLKQETGNLPIHGRLSAWALTSYSRCRRAGDKEARKS